MVPFLQVGAEQQEPPLLEPRRGPHPNHFTPEGRQSKVSSMAKIPGISPDVSWKNFGFRQEMKQIQGNWSNLWGGQFSQPSREGRTLEPVCLTRIRVWLTLTLVGPTLAHVCLPRIWVCRTLTLVGPTRPKPLYTRGEAIKSQPDGKFDHTRVSDTHPSVPNTHSSGPRVR